MQVAVDRTAPNGRIIGIDIIPAQPPKGVSTIQGNFLSEAVQQEVKNLLQDSQAYALNNSNDSALQPPASSLEARETELGRVDSIELESRARIQGGHPATFANPSNTNEPGRKRGPIADDGGRRLVHVVLSDMSAPWEQTAGFWKKSLSDPYFRMMNTSGMTFRDHAGSMVSSFPYPCYLRLFTFTETDVFSLLLKDLCDAALRFCFDTLRSGGHFVCKFYQGAEDKRLEAQLKILFAKVHREKPESSRTVSHTVRKTHKMLRSHLRSLRKHTLLHCVARWMQVTGRSFETCDGLTCPWPK